MRYPYRTTLIADGVRGTLGCLHLACSIPAVRAAMNDDDMLFDALEQQDDEALTDLADRIEGLEVDGLGTLEWRDGDIVAIEWQDADGACCVDCLHMMANGESLPDDDMDPADRGACTAGWCPASSCDEDATVDGFSCSACDCCGSQLGGERHAIVRLPHAAN
jgi:hypothetical protein